MPFGRWQDNPLGSPLPSCPYKRKGKPCPFPEKPSACDCPRLSWERQVPISFAAILPKMQIHFSCMGEAVCWSLQRQKSALCMGEDLSALFQICHACLSPVSKCNLPATSESLLFAKSWLLVSGGSGVLWLLGTAPEFCREM